MTEQPTTAAGLALWEDVGIPAWWSATEDEPMATRSRILAIEAEARLQDGESDDASVEWLDEVLP